MPTQDSILGIGLNLATYKSYNAIPPAPLLPMDLSLLGVAEHYRQNAEFAKLLKMGTPFASAAVSYSSLGGPLISLLAGTATGVVLDAYTSATIASDLDKAAAFEHAYINSELKDIFDTGCSGSLGNRCDEAQAKIDALKIDPRIKSSQSKDLLGDVQTRVLLQRVALSDGSIKTLRAEVAKVTKNAEDRDRIIASLKRKQYFSHKVLIHDINSRHVDLKSSGSNSGGEFEGELSDEVINIVLTLRDNDESVGDQYERVMSALNKIAEKDKKEHASQKLDLNTKVAIGLSSFHAAAAISDALGEPELAEAFSTVLPNLLVAGVSIARLAGGDMTALPAMLDSSANLITMLFGSHHASSSEQMKELMHSLNRVYSNLHSEHELLAKMLNQSRFANSQEHQILFDTLTRQFVVLKEISHDDDNILSNQNIAYRDLSKLTTHSIKQHNQVVSADFNHAESQLSHFASEKLTLADFKKLQSIFTIYANDDARGTDHNGYDLINLEDHVVLDIIREHRQHDKSMQFIVDQLPAWFVAKARMFDANLFQNGTAHISEHELSSLLNVNMWQQGARALDELLLLTVNEDIDISQVHDSETLLARCEEFRKSVAGTDTNLSYAEFISAIRSEGRLLPVLMRHYTAALNSVQKAFKADAEDYDQRVQRGLSNNSILRQQADYQAGINGLAPFGTLPSVYQIQPGYFARTSNVPTLDFCFAHPSVPQKSEVISFSTQALLTVRGNNNRYYNLDIFNNILVQRTISKPSIVNMLPKSEPIALTALMNLTSNTAVMNAFNSSWSSNLTPFVGMVKADAANRLSTVNVPAFNDIQSFLIDAIPGKLTPAIVQHGLIDVVASYQTNDGFIVNIDLKPTSRGTQFGLNETMLLSSRRAYAPSPDLNPLVPHPECGSFIDAPGDATFSNYWPAAVTSTHLNLLWFRSRLDHGSQTTTS